jgi:hypothetical protein
LVVQLGPFQARATVHALERLTTVADGVAEVLARLPVTSLDAPAGTNHDTQFQTRYLTHLLTALDYLELFGVDVHRYRLRTPLSIAYISLAVSGTSRGMRRGGFRWDPGLLRADGGADTASVRAEQALGDAARVLLRGDAGSGKTTLMQWIAVTAARHGFTGELDIWNGRTPFLIRLRDHVTQPLPAPERFLDLIAAPIVGLMPAGWVHRQLDAGAIVCIDGVDEVPEAQRRAVRDWLRGLLAAYPDLQVVVTSRPAAASARWLDTDGFTSVFLERMGPGDVKALIRHWHEAVRRAGDLPCQPHQLPGYEQRLLAQLDASAHLQSLAGSPLLCAMLCALNLDRDSNLPRNRMDIYQAAIDMLLHRRDSQRGVPASLPELTSRDQAQLLQEVAWWMTQNNRIELTRAEAEQRFTHRLAGIRHITAPATAVVEHMIQRSGILREPVPERIDFVHRTFQEYLAAREAADQAHTGALLEHAHLDTWRETIILAAGHANAPIRTHLLTGLLALADGHSKKARRLRLLAAACLETAPQVEPDTLTRIRAHLRGLPPRSVAEARSLAAVGEPLLTELPVDLRELSEAQAAATVRAVALVNGPSALATLARYSTDPRPRVQQQLIAVWQYFDPDAYADQVLADAPLDHGQAKIENPTLLPALPRLRHLTTTMVDISYDQQIDAAQLTDVPHLTELRIYCLISGKLDQLKQHPELRSIYLTAEQRQLDLSWLPALPHLTELSLWNLNPQQDLTELTRMPQLTHLQLQYGAQVTRDLLAALPDLESLGFTPGASWDPEMLDLLPKVTRLSLNGSGAPAGGLSALIRQLSRHHNITELWLHDCAWLTDLSPLAELPQLEWLSIGNGEHLFDLTPLAGIPTLKNIWIFESSSGLDVSPLRGKRVLLHLPRRLKLLNTGHHDQVRIRRF